METYQLVQQLLWSYFSQHPKVYSEQIIIDQRKSGEPLESGKSQTVNEVVDPNLENTSSHSSHKGDKELEKKKSEDNEK